MNSKCHRKYSSKLCFNTENPDPVLSFVAFWVGFGPVLGRFVLLLGLGFSVGFWNHLKQHIWRFMILFRQKSLKLFDLI